MQGVAVLLPVHAAEAWWESSEMKSGPAPGDAPKINPYDGQTMRMTLDQQILRVWQ